jgi:hypothetical protein
MGINIGDSIKTAVGGPYKVFRIDSNGVIWFKIKDGIGQTILSNVIEIIKAK